MKQLILSLALFCTCCGCAGGFKSTQTQTTASQATISVTTTSLPGATKGVVYSATLTASGGTAPYTWSIASGKLPAGLTLSSAGAITGTPASSGDFNFTVQVKDSTATTATARARTSVNSR